MAIGSSSRNAHAIVMSGGKRCSNAAPNRPISLRRFPVPDYRIIGPIERLRLAAENRTYESAAHAPNFTDFAIPAR